MWNRWCGSYLAMISTGNGNFNDSDGQLDVKNSADTVGVAETQRSKDVREGCVAAGS